jgi:hypothetical protein
MARKEVKMARRTHDQLRIAVKETQDYGVDVQLENNGNRVKFTTNDGSKNLSSLMSVSEAHEWFNGYMQNAIKLAKIWFALKGIGPEDLTQAEKQIIDIIVKDGI